MATCAICLEALGNDARPIPLVCGHVEFHSACLRRWFARELTCPLCRQSAWRVSTLDERTELWRRLQEATYQVLAADSLLVDYQAAVVQKMAAMDQFIAAHADGDLGAEDIVRAMTLRQERDDAIVMRGAASERYRAILARIRELQDEIAQVVG